MNRRMLGRVLFFGAGAGLSCWWASLCPWGFVHGALILAALWVLLIGFWLMLEG